MGIAALDERILYREFGVNAEYLIDHAHGVEPCTIAEIQAYRPQATSMVNGQVLARNYSYSEGLTILREMVDAPCSIWWTGASWRAPYHCTWATAARRAKSDDWTRAAAHRTATLR